MRIENIITKKGNIKYNSGDVLIVHNESKEGAYMVFKKYSLYYNLIDLNEGQLYFSDNHHYDDFVIKVEEAFPSAEVISNHELELVRVED